MILKKDKLKETDDKKYQYQVQKQKKVMCATHFLKQREKKMDRKNNSSQKEKCKLAGKKCGKM